LGCGDAGYRQQVTITTKEAVHRVRQARKVAVRTQLALTGAQILFWVALTGGVVALALVAWRRLRRNETPPQLARDAPAGDQLD
jgi:hypothetical protein